jgi:hypothetical protein
MSGGGARLGERGWGRTAAVPCLPRPTFGHGMGHAASGSRGEMTMLDGRPTHARAGITSGSSSTSHPAQRTSMVHESSCKLTILDFETQPTATAGGYRLMTRLPRAVTACGNRVPERGPARVGYTLTARAARKALWSRAVTAYRGPPPRGRRSNRGESSRGPRPWLTR